MHILSKLFHLILYFLQYTLILSSLFCHLLIVLSSRHQIGNGLFERSIDWLIYRSVDRLIDRSVDWSIDWLIEYRLIDRLIDWLIDRLVDWLIDWLIDWLYPSYSVLFTVYDNVIITLFFHLFIVLLFGHRIGNWSITRAETRPDNDERGRGFFLDGRSPFFHFFTGIYFVVMFFFKVPLMIFKFHFPEKSSLCRTFFFL